MADSSAHVDFEREGLLDGLDSEDERRARVDLLGELHERGVSLEELREAVAQDRLASLPLDVFLRRELRYTPRQVMDELRFEEPFVRRNYLSLGLPVPDLDELAISEADMEAWRMLRTLFDAGLDEDTVIQLGRLSGRGAAQLADLLLQTFTHLFLKAGDTERDFGLRIAELAANLEPALAPLTAGPVRLHLRDAVRRETVGSLERQRGEMPGTRPVAICFADIVGFTSLSERVGTPEVGAVTARLEAIAGECAQPPVRLVKLIGDAAMFVSTDTAALVETAVCLLDRVQREPALPELRVGIAQGDALNRAGDWYGRPVNTAARITAVAEPGTIAATAAVVEASGRQPDWVDAGTHRLKGIDEPVALQRLVCT